MAITILGKPDFSDLGECLGYFRYAIAMLLAANGETGEAAMEKLTAMILYWHKIVANPDSNSFIPYYKNSYVDFEMGENYFVIKVAAVSPDMVEKSKVDNESKCVNFNDKEVLNEAYEYLSEIYNTEDNAEIRTK